MGAVAGLLPVRFPWPPAEPGVPLARHRALHVPFRWSALTRLLVSMSTGSESCSRGSGIASLRRWMRR
jgi:hypothetical protein